MGLFPRISQPTIALIGPVPPPLNGQSVVTEYIIKSVRKQIPDVIVVDTGGEKPRFHAAGRQLLSSVRALFASRAAYIAVKAGPGMWLTSVTVLLARLLRVRVYLHHHSYAYILRRTARMVTLTRLAGPRATHIVLSNTMANDLRQTMPEIRSVLILGNAALIDRSLTELPLKDGSAEVVLGHLSNLSSDKGIEEVFELASAINRFADRKVRLIVAGPATDEKSRIYLDKAAARLGQCFEYWGQVSGARKREFFNDITHFVFPTRYSHEAMPLVLYEAMAAGVICLTTRRGSISEQLKSSGGLIAESAETFAEQALEFLLSGDPRPASLSLQARRAYEEALAAAEKQLAEFTDLLAE